MAGYSCGGCFFTIGVAIEMDNAYFFFTFQSTQYHISIFSFGITLEVEGAVFIVLVISAHFCVYKCMTGAAFGISKLMEVPPAHQPPPNAPTRQHAEDFPESRKCEPGSLMQMRVLIFDVGYGS
jgi:hypothetical protein